MSRCQFRFLAASIVLLLSLASQTAWSQVWAKEACDQAGAQCKDWTNGECGFIPRPNPCFYCDGTVQISRFCQASQVHTCIVDDIDPVLCGNLYQGTCISPNPNGPWTCSGAIIAENGCWLIPC